MSKFIHTYCDCCGKEITNKYKEPQLFVTMKIDGHEENHFCWDCSRILLDTWWKEVRKVKGQ